jgi:hypothetical protein
MNFAYDERVQNGFPQSREAALYPSLSIHGCLPRSLLVPSGTGRRRQAPALVLARTSRPPWLPAQVLAEATHGRDAS